MIYVPGQENSTLMEQELEQDFFSQIQFVDENGNSWVCKVAVSATTIYMFNVQIVDVIIICVFHSRSTSLEIWPLQISSFHCYFIHRSRVTYRLEVISRS